MSDFKLFSRIPDGSLSDPKKFKFYNLLLLIVLVFGIYNKSPNNLISIDESKADKSIKLVKCIDGDTINFSRIGKTRFLLVDTPESAGKYKNKPQYKGKEASKYTCDLLKRAKKITYEYDGNKKDKYNRSLAYIFVDGELIQEKIAEAGYVKKLYTYKSYYKYESKVRNAINDKYNLWEGS